MKAALVLKNQHLQWSEVPIPVLKPDEVLVRVHYAGVNRADLLQRAGDYPPPPGCPEWMGLEISGEITAVGDAVKIQSHWQVGDKVCALLGGGGYAQYAAVRWDMLMPVPAGCSMAMAAAIPEAFATCYLNLFLEGSLKKGQTLLMLSGTSGLASVMIPMAKAFGIRVITTVTSDEKAAQISHLRADRIVNTQKTDLREVLRQELEAGRPVDVAIDCLGGSLMGKCLPYLQRWGKWIMIAALEGEMTEVNLKNIYVRNIRIIGSTLRARPPELKAQILSSITREIFPKFQSGEVRPTLFAVYPIEEADAAHQLLLNRKSAGKVVLRVYDPDNNT